MHKFNRPWRRFYLKIIDSFESLFCIFFQVKNPWRMKLFFLLQFIYSVAEFILFWMVEITSCCCFRPLVFRAIFDLSNKIALLILGGQIEFWIFYLKKKIYFFDSCLPLWALCRHFYYIGSFSKADIWWTPLLPALSMWFVESPLGKS